MTDPPYGINYGNSGGFNPTHGWGPWRANVKWDENRPPAEVFNAILSLDAPTLIWGGNYFTDYLPPRMGWVAWDKGQRKFSLADFELAWTSEHKAARCVVYPRGRAMRDGKFHPTQKPIWVMEQCLEYLQRGRKRRLETVLDPFAGSGTTGIACVNSARHFVGIEKEPQYFDIAVKRMQAAIREQQEQLIPA